MQCRLATYNNKYIFIRYGCHHSASDNAKHMCQTQQIRGSATAERLRNVLCQLKYSQLLHNCTNNCTY